ncbi:hypothetical protein, partial [Thermomonas fusca]|uniref:hypothetical protein n=1 Tax=Thermomonas fusca TaxID=215690 RepID=UPI001FE665E0
VHQHVGMQPAIEAGKRNQQALQVALAVIVIEETGQPIVTPLHYVLGNTGEIGARQAGHDHSLPAREASVDQPLAQTHIGNCP